MQINMSNVERTQVNYKNLRITKKNSHICSAINLFQLHCRWLIKNFQAQIYLAIHSLYLAYRCKICIAFCLICLSSLSTWICIVAERPWGSSKSFVLCVLEVRELWSLRLSRKMDINFDRKIISNTNRQYLVHEFPVARVSFQTKITLQFDESQTIFAGHPLNYYWSLSFILSN